MAENPIIPENIPNFLTANDARQLTTEVNNRVAALNTTFAQIRSAAQAGAQSLEYEPAEQDYAATLNILTGAGFVVEELVEMPPIPEPIEGYDPPPPMPIRKYFSITWPTS